MIWEGHGRATVIPCDCAEVARRSESRRDVAAVERRIQRGRLIDGTPIFGCWVCGTPIESEPCTSHGEITTLEQLVDEVRYTVLSASADAVMRLAAALDPDPLTAPDPQHPAHKALTARDGES